MPVTEIRTVLDDCPFRGEGFRKVWRGCAPRGVRTSKERVRRLMREHHCSAGIGRATPRGPQVHDGTIIPETMDAMWGTDMTATMTTKHGQVAVFVAVDHCSAECVGIHAALDRTRSRRSSPCARRGGALRRDRRGWS